MSGKQINRMTRRQFLKVAGAAAGVAATGSFISACAPAGTPTPAAAAKPDKLVFVCFEEPSNTFIFKAIDKFTEDYGVEVERISVPDKEYFEKCVAMFTAKDQIDCLFVRDEYLSNWVSAGFIEPMTGSEGIDQYKDLLAPVAWQHANYKNEFWGLPYYGGVFTSWYYDANFEKAGLDTLPETWDELVEHALKAKKDGVCEYPVLNAIRLGPMHLPWVFYQLVWCQGGTIFDKDGNHTLGPGSQARKSLEWWRKTYLEWEIADPKGIGMGYYPGYKALWTGEYLYHFFAMDYTLSMVNNPADNPLPGKIRNFTIPGNHKSIGWVRLYGRGYTGVSKEWSWKLMQYVGGMDKDGDLYGPRLLILDAAKEGMGLLQPYPSLMEEQGVAEVWKQYADWDLIIEAYKNSSHVSACVGAFYEPWYYEWQDYFQVQVEQCLTGEISSDEAMDNAIAKIDELKKG